LLHAAQLGPAGYTSWRKLAVYYVICYFSFWILFSMLYYPMTNWPKCREATNVYTWQDAMQLSVMVSSTIGFGYVHMSYACSWYPFAVLMVQVLVGELGCAPMCPPLHDAICIYCPSLAPWLPGKER
jgi:hypothetical protein